MGGENNTSVEVGDDVEIVDMGLKGLPMAHTEDWRGQTVLVHPDERSKPPSVFSGSVILLNSTVGSGVLSMPYAVAHLGVIFGPIFIVIMAVLSVISMRMLGSISERCLQNAALFHPIDRSSSITPSPMHHEELSLEELSSGQHHNHHNDPSSKSEDENRPRRNSTELSHPTALSPEHEGDNSPRSPKDGAKNLSVLTTTQTPGYTPSTSADHIAGMQSPSPSPGLNMANAARPRVTFPWVAKQVVPWSSYVLDAGLILMCFGVIVAYFIVISQTAITIVNNLSGTTAGDTVESSLEWLSSTLLPSSSSSTKEAVVSTGMKMLRSRYFWICLIFVIVAPLTFLKRIEALRYLGYINMFCIVYLVVMMITYLCLHIDEVKAAPDYQYFPSEVSAISSLPMIVFGFTSQANFFAIFDEISEPRKKNACRCVLISSTEAAIIYAIIGLSGAFVSGRGVPSNIMTAFPASEWFIIVGRFSVCINVSTCIPLCFHPLRTCIEGIVEEIADKCGKKTTEPVRRCCVAGIVMALELAVALSFTKLDVVLSLAGSTGGSIVAFILPGFLYFVAFPERRKSVAGVFSLIMLVFGIIFMIVCVVVTLINV